MQRDDFACYDCGNSDETLAVHHTYYLAGRLPWQYPTWSLKTLCSDCHNHKHRLDADDLDGFESVIGGFVGDGSGGEMAQDYAIDISSEFFKLSKVIGRQESFEMIMRAILEMREAAESKPQQMVGENHGR